MDRYIYSVRDMVNGVSIVDTVVCNNDLTAALGFYNSFIKYKNPSVVSYKMLELYCLGGLHEDSKGKLDIYQTLDGFSCKGSDIVDFIQSEYDRLGIDDDFIDDNNEVKE